MKIVMATATAVMLMLKTAQTREIMTNRNLAPIELKNIFEMIVMMSSLITTLVLMGDLNN